jgi:hypothetical protein
LHNRCSVLPFFMPPTNHHTHTMFPPQALNAMKMREVLAEAPGLASDRLVIPQPLLELTTRCAWCWGFLLLRRLGEVGRTPAMSWCGACGQCWW